MSFRWNSSHQLLNLPTEARRFLGAITDVAGRSISKDELLWPLSMPPRINAQEIQVAQLENEFERHYRNYLAENTGTKPTSYLRYPL